MEFPLAFGLLKTGWPLILTSGKLENICFLIDTGSTHNIIFSHVYKHFRDEFEILDTTNNIIGIEGILVEALVIKATLNFEGVDYTSKFSVYDGTSAISRIQEESGVQLHGVLGIEFLLENGWIIDFEKKIVKDSTKE